MFFRAAAHRRSPNELALPPEPGDGWLFAVAGDDGGVAWRQVRLVVE